MTVKLCICGSWEHYATEHNVLPPKAVRDAVMAADPSKAVVTIKRWHGPGECRICGKQAASFDYIATLPDQTLKGEIVNPGSSPLYMVRGALSIFFVSKVGDGYNHKIGDSPDTEFIKKLDKILEKSGMDKKIFGSQPAYLARIKLERSNIYEQKLKEHGDELDKKVLEFMVRSKKKETGWYKMMIREHGEEWYNEQIGEMPPEKEELPEKKKRKRSWLPSFLRRNPKTQTEKDIEAVRKKTRKQMEKDIKSVKKKAKKKAEEESS